MHDDDRTARSSAADGPGPDSAGGDPEESRG